MYLIFGFFFLMKMSLLLAKVNYTLTQKNRILLFWKIDNDGNILNILLRNVKPINHFLHLEKFKLVSKKKADRGYLQRVICWCVSPCVRRGLVFGSTLLYTLHTGEEFYLQ